MQLPSTTTDGRNERNFRTFTQGLRKLGKHQTIDIVGHFEVKHKFPSATALQLQQQGDWGSYSFSLIVDHFLQKETLLRRTQHVPDQKEIQGTRWMQSFSIAS